MKGFVQQTPLCLAGFLSGILLFAAFPPLEWTPAGWIALFPLMAACAFLAPRNAARQGLLAGLTFFLPSLFWLTRVTWVGWLALSIYCAVYPALFALLIAYVFQYHRNNTRHNTVATFFILTFSPPTTWVTLEYLRSILFTGFPWNTLAISQYSYPALIQTAAWGGIYMVSFTMILPSSLLLVLFLTKPLLIRWWQPATVAGTLIAALWCAYNCAAPYRADISLNAPNAPQTALDIALVQLNVPQDVKWEDAWSGDIYRRLKNITQTILADTNDLPDLVVWPETVMPDFFRGNSAAMHILENLLQHGTPILAGSMDWDETHDHIRYYNSSFMLRSGAALNEVYNKRHLVLLGEYVPWENIFSWLRALTPIGDSFTPGTEATVFNLKDNLSLAPLICFEDIIAGLARASVRKGGRLLANQTNDAWFDPQPAARQHMAHCVFRCIENRTPAVRSANTGVTCFINQYGRVIAELPRVTNHPASPTFLRHTITVPPPDMPLTFYTKYGDVFVGACALFTLLALLGPALGYLGFEI